jgi:DNA-binding NarL/FixJ family response regulator
MTGSRSHKDGVNDHTRPRDAEAAPLRPEPQLVERFARLTPREREVLECIAQQKLSKQIAAELGISENTVNGYRKSALSKMGARNMTELLMLALRAGLVARPRR